MFLACKDSRLGCLWMHYRQVAMLGVKSVFRGGPLSKLARIPRAIYLLFVALNIFVPLFCRELLQIWSLIDPRFFAPRLRTCGKGKRS
jgi:hypothetical protein